MLGQRVLSSWESGPGFGFRGWPSHGFTGRVPNSGLVSGGAVKDSGLERLILESLRVLLTEGSSSMVAWKCT